MVFLGVKEFVCLVAGNVRFVMKLIALSAGMRMLGSGEMNVFALKGFMILMKEVIILYVECAIEAAGTAQILKLAQIAYMKMQSS
jgi:hypothetical protein